MGHEVGTTIAVGNGSCHVQSANNGGFDGGAGAGGGGSCQQVGKTVVTTISIEDHACVGDYACHSIGYLQTTSNYNCTRSM